MKHTRVVLLIALLGAAAVGLPNLRGATITVTEVGDSDSVPGTFRKALADANDGDTIEFNPLLGGRNLQLAAVFGQLVVNKNINIRWVPVAGYNSYLGVDANHASRVFYISPGKTVTISGLTIINGSAPAPNYNGGGIYNDHATLTVNNCTISGNSTALSVGDGGGIYNDHGTLTVSRSTLSSNSAFYAAAIFNDGYNGRAILAITNSTVTGNTGSVCGGIYNEGYGGSANLAITNSTLSSNSAVVAAGAIYNGSGGTLTITNGTLSGNSASYGQYGGGIYNVDGGTLTIGDTILNAGSLGENIYNQSPGTVNSLGYNLSSDDGGGYLTAAGDRINTDPRLGPLQDNGGPTFTHLPASGSPAIDGSDPERNMDQRGPGFVRVVNGRADVGAVEVQAASSPTPTPTPTPRPRGRH